jgi:hypothetical protein
MAHPALSLFPRSFFFFLHPFPENHTTISNHTTLSPDHQQIVAKWYDICDFLVRTIGATCKPT